MRTDRSERAVHSGRRAESCESAPKWLVAQRPHRPPPPLNTRPSSISTATEWYVRGAPPGASGVHVSVSGSNISANKRTHCCLRAHAREVLRTEHT